MPALLPAHARLIPRHPQQRRLARYRRMIIRIALDDRVVCDIREAARDKAAEGMVIGVEVRTEEFGDEVWFLVGSWAESFGCCWVAVYGGDGCGGDAVVAFFQAVRRGGAVFGGEEGFFFRFEGFGEEFEEGVKCGVEREVEEDDEDQEHDHEDDGTRRGFDAEKSDKADDGKIGACRGLLQGPRVDETFRVNVRVDDKEKIVSIG